MSTRPDYFSHFYSTLQRGEKPIHEYGYHTGKKEIKPELDEPGLVKKDYAFEVAYDSKTDRDLKDKSFEYDRSLREFTQPKDLFSLSPRYPRDIYTRKKIRI